MMCKKMRFQWKFNKILFVIFSTTCHWQNMMTFNCSWLAFNF